MRSINKYLNAISTNTVFFVVNSVFFLTITPIAVKVMGDELYGSWAILSAIVAFSQIGSFGIGSVVTKFSAPSTNEKTLLDVNAIITSAFLIILPLTILTVAILISLRDIIVNSINVNSVFHKQFYDAFLVMVLSIFPLFLSRIPQGYLYSQFLNQLAQIPDFLSSIVGWIGFIVISLYTKNLYWMSLWYFFTQVVMFIIFVLFFQKKLHFVISIDINLIQKMLKFSFLLFTQSIANILSQQFDRLAVGFLLGPVFAGAYSIGTSVGLRLSIIAGLAATVMTPYSSLKDSLKDWDHLYKTFRKLSYYVSLIVSGIGAGLILWMFEVLSIWISPSYAIQYSNIFSILVLAYSLWSMCRPGHETLIGLGYVHVTMTIYLLSTIIMLAMLYFFSQKFGLIGAALANSFMALMLVENLLVSRFLTGKFLWKDIIQDLKWGLFLPVGIYFFTLLMSPSLIIKIVIFSILLFVYLNIFLHDNFIKELKFHLFHQERK